MDAAACEPGNHEVLFTTQRLPPGVKLQSFSVEIPGPGDPNRRFRISSAETEAAEQLLLKSCVTKPAQSAQPAIGSESQVSLQQLLGGKFQALTFKKRGNSHPGVGSVSLLLAGKEPSQV